MPVTWMRWFSAAVIVNIALKFDRVSAPSLSIIDIRLSSDASDGNALFIHAPAPERILRIEDDDEIEIVSLTEGVVNAS